MKLNLSDLAEAEARREAVRNAASNLLAGEWSLRQLRQRIEEDGVADAPPLWNAMQELGWDRIASFGGGPEEGFGPAELCAIVEETGRALAPTPLVPCVVGRAILRDAGVPTTASLPVLAHAEPGRSLDRLSTTVTATATDGAHRLVGTKRFVPYGLQADLVVVNAQSNDGTTMLFAVDPSRARVERRPLLLLDGSPCAELRLDGVDLPSSTQIAVGDAATALLRDAIALEILARSAELVGVAARALDLAVDYAKTRIAFGRPIGSFQAVQHKLVNLRACVEICRALYQGAARIGADDRDERDAAVSLAAFAAIDDLRKAPEGALQVFGGMGTTWEHDIHFFVRRAATLCALLGERAGFREDVARRLARAR
jgi:alkylation response protein AidB-like acyl-CoA dehydrogenase